MKIRDVLAVKGRHVETTYPSKPLSEVARQLSERNIASLIVVDTHGRPLGIITDRHLIRTLAKSRDWGEAELKTARDVMESPVPVCILDLSIDAALREMTERRTRHLLVVTDGQTEGLVSIGDLVKARRSDAELESRILRDLAYAHMAEGAAPPVR